jgi:hypothetical protein
MELDDGWMYDVNGFDLRTDVGKELEEAHVNLDMDLSMHLYEEHPDPDYEPPSGFPYCGCETCQAREHLWVLVPLIARATMAGTIRPTRVAEIAPDVDTSVVVPLAPVAGSSRQKAGTPKKENDDPARARDESRYDPAHPSVHSICASCGEPNGVHRIGCPRPR